MIPLCLSMTWFCIWRGTPDILHSMPPPRHLPLSNQLLIERSQSLQPLGPKCMHWDANFATSMQPVHCNWCNRFHRPNLGVSDPSKKKSSGEGRSFSDGVCKLPTPPKKLAGRVACYWYSVSCPPDNFGALHFPNSYFCLGGTKINILYILYKLEVNDCWGKISLQPENASNPRYKPLC